MPITLTQRFSLISFYLGVSSLVLCFISLLTIVFFPGISTKIFRLSGILAFISILFNFRDNIKNSIFYIVVPLFILGVIDLLWYETFKFKGSPYSISYYGHFEFGKNAILASFIAITATNRSVIAKLTTNHYALAAFLAQLMALGYALYQYYYLGMERIVLALEGGANATGAAYLITFITLFSGITLLYSRFKHKNLFFLFSVAIGFYTTVLTGTRSSLIVLPVLSLAAFFLYGRVRQKINPRKACLTFIIIVFCVVAAKDIFIKRYDAFVSDIVAYQAENSSTSIGARFAMTGSGYLVSYKNIFWQSAESRNEQIKQLASKQPIYAAALLHFHAHLHNDIIETLSLKGWSGLAFLFFFFISALIYAFTDKQRHILAIYIAAIFLYGLSDVMFFARNVSLGWMVPMVLLLSFLVKKQMSLNSRG